MSYLCIFMNNNYFPTVKNNVKNRTYVTLIYLKPYVFDKNDPALFS